MNTQVSKQIMERFYSALDAIIAKKDIRGVATYCRLYEIDRRNFVAQRHDLDRGWFQLSWLQPMIKDFNVNARWLLTGYGRMFDNEKQEMKEFNKIESSSTTNSKGSKLERDGKTEQAIQLYESSIKNGDSTHHPYKRLITLYHKQRDYENEKRVIKAALNTFGKYPFYVERLSKIEDQE